MRARLRLPHALRLGAAGCALALELATGLVPAQPVLAQSAAPAAVLALTQSSVSPCGGPSDYPVAGGWFYSEEAFKWPCITDHGPSRSRGYLVVDDADANFWTEFRRFGGVQVLGFPVSQRYQYPVGSVGGLWYQAFERGVLQWHPDTQRAELANVFDQFTDNGLDGKLEEFGIPQPQNFAASDFSTQAEQRMGLLVEPQFLARYFFDPVGFHSSEPGRNGQAAFATQEQAWSFFGFPATTAQRLTLESNGMPLYPLTHTFIAQRFQKAGLQLFLEDSVPEAYGAMTLDPTIVPGDGRKGCVALTAVGLLARTIGAGSMIPTDKIPPLPLPGTAPFAAAYVAVISTGQSTVTFELAGSGFKPGEPVTIRLSDGLSPTGAALPVATSHVASAFLDGSFDQIVTARLGSYTLNVTGDTSARAYVAPNPLDLAVASIKADPTQMDSTSRAGGTGCSPVGVPVGN